MAKKESAEKPKTSASKRSSLSASIDEYISNYSGDIKKRLIQIRETVRHYAPDAVEKISYSMPTYWQGKNLIHFAAMKNHIGLYPGAEGVAAFSKELEDYKTSKGTIQLPNDRPLPLDLIAKIIRYRLKSVLTDCI